MPSLGLLREKLIQELAVFLRPYSENDFGLLEKLLGDPKMTMHLGGPESAKKLRERHVKFTAMSKDPSAGCVFVITVGEERTPAGTVGFWEREWKGEKVWETGYSVLPEFQGQGIATKASRLVVAKLSGLRKYRYLYAFPSVDNPASNAICRKSGFALLGVESFEYPPGSFMRCNIWRVDLSETIT